MSECTHPRPVSQLAISGPHCGLERLECPDCEAQTSWVTYGTAWVAPKWGPKR